MGSTLCGPKLQLLALVASLCCDKVAKSRPVSDNVVLFSPDVLAGLHWSLAELKVLDGQSTPNNVSQGG